MAATAKKRKDPPRQPEEQRVEDLEAGSALFVAVAYHYARWDGEDGDCEILDEEDTDEVVVGVFTSERLYRIGVECYFEEHKAIEGGNGPICAIAVFQSNLNQHGTGPVVNGFDADSGWRL
jgi:hypothetical protein